MCVCVCVCVCVCLNLLEYSMLNKAVQYYNILNYYT